MKLAIIFSMILLFTVAQGKRTSEELSQAPAIIFFVDGMRPDTLKQMALDGSVPALKEVFLDKGVEFETHTSRSVSLPSWSTIITGVEIDRHGIRANTPTQRGGGLTNFLDYRWDLLLLNNWSASRSQQFVNESKIKTLPSYFSPSSFVGYSPINDGVLPPIGGFVGHLVKEGIYFLYDIGRDTVSGSEHLDGATTHAAVKAMGKNPNLRLVTLWLSTIDHMAHESGATTVRAFEKVDEQINKVLEAARNHHTLRNANVFLISDHGQTGECLFGYSPECSMPSKLLTENKVPKMPQSPFKSANSEFKQLVLNQSYLSNSAFNIISLFLGTNDNLGESNPFCYDVASAHPEFSDYDLAHLSRFLLNPERKIEKASGNQDRSKIAALDFEADNVVQVYLPSEGSTDRKNYYEMTHQAGCRDGADHDLLGTLLDVTMDYHGNNVPEIVQGIMKNFGVNSTGRVRPVDYVAIPLLLEKNDGVKDLFEKFLGHTYDPKRHREPVLIRGGSTLEGSKWALIFTERDGGVHGSAASDMFRYVVLKSFSVEATSNGQKVLAVAAENAREIAERDPLDLGDKVLVYSEAKGVTLNLNQGRSDREWLGFSKMVGSETPTALFSLARMLTMDPQYPVATLKKRQTEIPDFIVVANPGFSFNPGGRQTSDHGAFSLSEVRTSFFVGKLSQGATAKAHSKVPESVYGVDRSENYLVRGEFLTRDILPTVLDLSGLKNPKTWRPEWISLRDAMEGKQ